MDGIFVTNKNPELHADRYNGEDYVFPPGEKVFVPKAAATHMLGWNMKDKSDALVRLGKAMRYDPALKNFVEDSEGVRWLANFVFDEAVMVPQSTLAAKLSMPEIA
jgi:hypothetical protein